MEKPNEATPQQNRVGDSETARAPSLVRGGPFYRVQEALRLLTPQHWNLGRRILLAIGVGWAPLILLSLLSKPNTISTLLKDYTVNIRMLIAVPVLLAGQVIMENVFRTIIHHLREAYLLPWRNRRNWTVPFHVLSLCVIRSLPKSSSSSSLTQMWQPSSKPI
jgi:hypothetical protein